MGKVFQHIYLYTIFGYQVYLDEALVTMLAIGLVSIMCAKSKWEKLAEEERDRARKVAYRDALTGVKSKHAFAVQEGQLETKIVEEEIDEFGVVICDLNGLKQVNDTQGHQAGDEYIRAACKMLCNYYKHSPVFRIGGDEFAVLLQGRDYEARYDILNAINAEIESNLTTGKVVASLGMAEFDKEKDQSFHEVFKRADEMMYERKLDLKRRGAETRD